MCGISQYEQASVRLNFLKETHGLRTHAQHVSGLLGAFRRCSASAFSGLWFPCHLQADAQKSRGKSTALPGRRTCRRPSTGRPSTHRMKDEARKHADHFVALLTQT